MPREFIFVSCLTLAGTNGTFG